MVLRFSFSLLLLSSVLSGKSGLSVDKKISCRASHGFVIMPFDRSKKWILTDELAITAVQGKCHINGRKTRYERLLVCGCGESSQLWVNGTFFQGQVLITTSGDAITVEPVQPDDFDCNDERPCVIKKRCDKQTALKIKVLLARETLASEKREFLISTASGFFIAIQSKKLLVSQDTLTIEIGDGLLLLNKKPLPEGLHHIETRGDDFLFNGKRYKGSLFVRIEKGKVFFVNAVDLEEYVYAVLRSESWPGWSIEVNKALAVACRSYAVALMERSAPGALYHIKSSNIHQQYNLYGEHDNKAVRKAVEQTHGICLTYNKKPALAMYDSCCGGIIPALVDELDFKKAPYLARTYACHYCKKSSLYEWKIAFEKSHFVVLLEKIGISIKNISHISVLKRDKAGMVKSIKIKDRKKELILSGKAMYSVAKEIKSFSFSIKHTKNSLEFFGKGYGHPYGLCQWGTHKMVQEGSLFDQVLQFYYPGTELKTIRIKGG